MREYRKLILMMYAAIVFGALLITNRVMLGVWWIQ